MATTANSNIRLLTVLVDCNDEEEGDYRFLVDEKHVKYVTVDPGVFIPKGRSDLCARAHSSAATFPPGNWNEGHISKDPLTQRPVFARVTRSDLPEIRNTWHDRRIDHLELKELDRVRQNIHHVTCPAFDVPVLVKFAEFHWQMPYFKAETTAYEWIEGKGIGPRFLGHLTEDGRDLAACQRILAKLHALGIKHGDINKHNFLVRDGEAVLVDFETAQKCSDEAELEAEYEHLESSLRDPSRRGGVGSPVIDGESDQD
ncbi:hypothetical protein F5B17DRAFT_439454 [Nemania serpens]|nr:hypothetical protein F5B17DRAFT_439454 [Nemania serpens]